jgi:hypothetical protein
VQPQSCRAVMRPTDIAVRPFRTFNGSSCPSTGTHLVKR